MILMKNRYSMNIMAMMMNNKNGNCEANQKDEEHADEMLLGYSEKRRLRQTRGEWMTSRSKSVTTPISGF